MRHGLPTFLTFVFAENLAVLFLHLAKLLEETLPLLDRPIQQRYDVRCRIVDFTIFNDPLIDRIRKGVASHCSSEGVKADRAAR